MPSFRRGISIPLRGSSPRVRRAIGLLAAVGLLLATGSPLAADSAHELASAHFLVQYTVGTGDDAVAAEYAALVRDAMEEAYRVLVTEGGFSLLPGQISVLIRRSEDAEYGSEYLDEDAQGNPRPVIEIAPESSMKDAIADLVVRPTVEEEVRSTAAHELFHAVQETLALRGTYDFSEIWLTEALATWAQELVVPRADDYLDSAIDFLVGPDSLSFFSRTYDAGIFWTFVAARHGAEAVRHVMTASAAYEGRYVVDAAFREKHLTFDDLWEAFAVALAAGTLPDGDVIATLLPDPSATVRSPRTKGLALPPSVWRGEWQGGTLTIGEVNARNPSPILPEFAEDPVGSPLRVAHAYGIDLLDLTSAAARPFEILLSGDAGTAFRANVVIGQGATQRTARLVPEAPLQIEGASGRIRIVVTRGEAGTGAYTLTVREG